MDKLTFHSTWTTGDVVRTQAVYRRVAYRFELAAVKCSDTGIVYSLRVCPQCRLDLDVAHLQRSISASTSLREAIRTVCSNIKRCVDFRRAKEESLRLPAVDLLQSLSVLKIPMSYHEGRIRLEHDGRTFSFQWLDGTFRGQYRFLTVQDSSLERAYRALKESVEKHSREVETFEKFIPAHFVCIDRDDRYLVATKPSCSIAELTFDADTWILNKEAIDLVSSNLLMTLEEQEAYGCGVCFQFFHPTDCQVPNVICPKCPCRYHHSCWQDWLDMSGGSSGASDAAPGRVPSNHNKVVLVQGQRCRVTLCLTCNGHILFKVT